MQQHNLGMHWANYGQIFPIFEKNSVSQTASEFFGVFAIAPMFTGNKQPGIS